MKLGPLDVLLNTESKYDDCRLLHLPNLELKLNIDWQCRPQYYSTSVITNLKDLSVYNHANFHNYVVPCAPDKTPIIVNSFEHDSYSQFRSENVNLKFSFICNPSSDTESGGAHASEEEPPTCKLYASTSRFLERIKILLSSITRPTKRGKIFANLKARKPLLSRHFKLVQFDFDLPRIRIVYWSSANEQYGIHLDARHFKLNSTQKLDLIPHPENLKRRPRPTWSIQLMKFNVEEVEAYLMSPPQAFSSADKITKKNSEKSAGLFNQAEYDLLQLQTNSSVNEISSIIKLFETKEASKSFFVKIDSIYYEREADAQYNAYSLDNNADDKANCLLNFSDDYDTNCGNKIGLRALNRFSYSLKTDTGTKSCKKTEHNKGKKICVILIIASIVTNKFFFDLEKKSYLNINASHSNVAVSGGSFKFNTKPHQNNIGNTKSPSNENNSINRPKNSTNSLLEPNSAYFSHYNASNDAYKFSHPTENSNLTLTNVSMTSLVPFQVTNMPKHNLVVKNLKCKWNNANRDVVYILYDIYNKSKQLRHNLSTNALKEYDLLTDQIVQNYFLNQQQQHQRKNNNSTPSNRNSFYSSYNTIKSQKYSNQSTAHFDLLNTSNIEKKADADHSHVESNRHFEDLLNRLDSERATNLNIYCNEEPPNKSFNYFENFLYGLNTINKMSDIKSQNVSIEFINSQIKLSSEENNANPINTNLNSNNSSNNLLNLKGQGQTNKFGKKSECVNSSASGGIRGNNEDYLIISAARANVVQCIHNSVWKCQRYLEKTSLSGYLENMQYFATLNTVKRAPASEVSANKTSAESSEYWLSDDIINIDGNNVNEPTVNTEKGNDNDMNETSNYIIDINGIKDNKGGMDIFKLAYLSIFRVFLLI